MSKGITNVSENNKNAKNLVNGMCHEKADLTRQSGYKYVLLKLVDLTKDNVTVVRRDFWWKTYNIHVCMETRHL